MPAPDRLRMHRQNENTLSQALVEVVKIAGPDLIYVGRRSESWIDAVASPNMFEDWKVVEPPSEWQFDQLGRAAPNEWSIVWDLIADAAVIGREILAHHAAIV